MVPLDDIVSFLDTAELSRLSQVTVKLWQGKDKRWHQGGYNHCGTGGWIAAVASVPHQTFSITQAQADPAVCSECVASKLVESRHWMLTFDPWPVSAIHVAWWAAATKEEAEKIQGRNEKGLRVAKGRLVRAKERHAESLMLLGSLPGRHADADILNALRDLSDQSDTALSAAEASSNTNAARERALTIIRKDLSPTGADEMVGLSTQEMLIGIAPGTFWGPSRFVEEVLTLFTVHQTQGGRGLIAPRYVYDYLQRACPASAWRRARVCAVPAPAEHLRETVLAVWNPSGEGDLIHLANAVAAAELL